MKPNKTFIIRHRETKEIFHASSGKSGWREAGHAKLAFANSIQGAKWSTADHILNQYGLKKSDFKYKGSGQYDFRFDSQNVYEVVELKSKSEDHLKVAIECIKEFINFCDPNYAAEMGDLVHLESRASKFIKEVEGDLQ